MCSRTDAGMPLSPDHIVIEPRRQHSRAVALENEETQTADQTLPRSPSAKTWTVFLNNLYRNFNKHGDRPCLLKQGCAQHRCQKLAYVNTLVQCISNMNEAGQRQ